MKKYDVYYCCKNGKPMEELKDFIPIGHIIEANSRGEAAVKAAEEVGRDNMLFQVIEIFSDGFYSDQFILIDFPETGKKKS